MIWDNYRKVSKKVSQERELISRLTVILPHSDSLLFRVKKFPNNCSNFIYIWKLTKKFPFILRYGLKRTMTCTLNKPQQPPWKLTCFATRTGPAGTTKLRYASLSRRRNLLDMSSLTNRLLPMQMNWWASMALLSYVAISLIHCQMLFFLNVFS